LGYRLKAGTLKYNNGSGDTAVNETTKKFTMPASNVAVSAEFETTPGLIHDAVDLAKIGTESYYPMSDTYELTANITLPSGWAPIGNGTAPFTGTFDGKGKTITINSFPSAGVDISAATGMEDFSDMIADWSGTTSDIIARGLFAYTDENAVIKDLNITVNPGSSFVITSTPQQQVQLFGIVAAAAVNTTFTDINISGGVLDMNASSVETPMLGGIAGVLLEGSSMTGCTVDIKITASLNNTAFSSVGGMVGWIDESSGITDCFVLKDVETTGGSGGNDDSLRGGLAGYNGGTITNSSVSGNVSITSTSGDSRVGGLVGMHSGSIENCSVTGNVSVDSTASGDVNIKVGGLVAQFEGQSAVIRKSYSTGTVSAQNTSTAGGARVRAGGIAGNTYEDVEITDCYSAGHISAEGGNEVSVGGIVGDSGGDTVVTIEHCYVRGTISASGTGSNKSVGGIVGVATVDSGSAITGCAALSDSIVGGVWGTNRIIGAIVVSP
jgi:hypothetical protein